MTELEFRDRYIKARKQIIASNFKKLNDMQRSAVMATEGPLLILAGAGSGKTTVLINRIANLMKYGRGSDSDEIPSYVSADDLQFIEEYAIKPQEGQAMKARALSAVEPVEPWRIIAITFTNKAADELKARLENILGDQARDIWAMTFHSACVRILRRDIERLGYSRDFTIYDTTDSLSLIKRILKDLNMDDKTFPPRTVLGYISRAKDEMQGPNSFIKTATDNWDVRKKQIGEAYKMYSEHLKNANAVDFDDLILLTVKLLTENEDVREYYQRRFKYVLIDEYQDTNNLQYLLASTLAGGYKNICVVGDDDQSIYKFRGATIENILSFEKQHKNSRVIRLEQNYRSTGNILASANAVIRNNLGRKGKELWTNKDNGEKLTLYIAQNENDEAQFVASKVLAGFGRGDNWRDYAVLYRMNAQSNQLEYAFKRNGIPYRVIGGMRFFDRAEIKDILAYLCVINNPDDDLRLLRIINNPPRGIGTKTIETALSIAQQEQRPLYEIIKNATYYSELSKAASKLSAFVNIMEGLKDELSNDEMSLEIFYDDLLEKSGYLAMLKGKNTDENISRIENIGELKSNIINYVEDSEDGTLAGFLDEIALYTDIEQYDKDSDCVVMMTMHSAKGLEFPNVFIVGAEEGIFPGIRAIGETEEMEEERRLCYVAITRAREKLYITCARQRMLFGRTTANKVSRFVEEIPDENIEKPEPRKPAYSEYIENGHKYPPEKQKSRPIINSAVRATQPQQSASFRKGDMVEHKAFGRGMIVSIQPAGGDALVEIAFDGVGTKRLMMKAASQYMKKL